MSHALDVVGIGNALVDILSHEDDAFVERLGLAKGSMTLVDDARAEEVHAAMGAHTKMSGGSAANTVAGVASLGGRGAFVGRVARDHLGTVFAEDLRSLGVRFDCVAAAHGPATGRCLVIVTPDARRTMCTYLGASSMLGPHEVAAELVQSAHAAHLEGYLWDRPEAKDAYRRASRLAHEAGRKVSFSLSDRFCVERHRAEWRQLVRDEVDILFANEEEAQALYETDDFEEAVEGARGDCEIACVTRGPKGSVIASGPTTVEVDAHPPERVVDTTGAGDLYAAGVLYGLTHGMDLERCGQLGSLAASVVIAHTGARPDRPLSELL